MSKPGSQAERAGLVRGDVISEINKKEIRSLTRLRSKRLRAQE